MSESTPPLDDALALMRDLRARCEWDAAQTHQSLRPYLVEEAHEVDDALRAGDDRALREELGDLLLQVLFHSVIAEERGAFSLQDVSNGLIAKMRARHPHLYEGGERQSWEAMKATKAERRSVADGLPVELPALHRAHRLQDRASGYGFDWPDVHGPAAKVREEIAEVEAELSASPPTSGPTGAPVYDAQHARLEAELGDLLFAVVNLCRKAGVHASNALDRANGKFVGRLDGVMALAKARGLDLRALSVEELDVLWETVKRGE
ncbi:MAG: nucleoside triphosphate pyrophosphohydrolase [Gemmatimonadaceae bacterium]|nr:nucleoside triphosphate pyrophosphohydrolase [Gemmatimonadaceae bacterium]